MLRIPTITTRIFVFFVSEAMFFFFKCFFVSEAMIKKTIVFSIKMVKLD